MYNLIRECEETSKNSIKLNGYEVVLQKLQWIENLKINIRLTFSFVVVSLFKWMVYGRVKFVSKKMIGQILWFNIFPEKKEGCQLIMASASAATASYLSDHFIPCAFTTLRASGVSLPCGKWGHGGSLLLCWKCLIICLASGKVAENVLNFLSDGIRICNRTAIEMTLVGLCVR